MRTEPFDFTNSRGQRISARLDRPDRTPQGFALFAHCFTCEKNSKAAVRISRALAGLGVAVLRFDFTGLGESEGELTGFSANVEDVVTAARHMETKGFGPALLLGHSLGGAAVLAAAGDIGSARAVATIAAPADPAHVLKLLGAGLKAIEAEGKATVSIGGRPFTLDRAFVEDARLQRLSDRIARLGRALLILHSPVDSIVGIENATEIFLAARHPKSFVTLDKADHLLTRPEDADYAAAVIAAWAGRYVGATADRPAEAPGGAVLAEETGAGKLQVQVTAHGARFFADEPVEVGGMDSGPTPFELVAAGLGACTCMTVRLYADRKGWPLERVRASVVHEKDAELTPPDRFERGIGLEGPLNPDQVARLFEIAEKCPVHRMLEAGSRVVTGPMQPVDGATARDGPAADPEDHFREMDAVCREAGAAPPGS
jgi:putative redox protein